MRRQQSLSCRTASTALLLLSLLSTQVASFVPRSSFSSFPSTTTTTTTFRRASTITRRKTTRPLNQRPSSTAAAAATTAIGLESATVETPAQPKVGVLLLNLGGPETSDDVEGFLFNLFADPDIIRLPGPLAPLQNVIAYFISKRRAPQSRAAYESIGGGSPILKYSNQQADLVKASLQERYGLDVQTYIGMRYWKPFTEQALEQIRRDQIEALVILPLYPQFSISTSGSSLRVLQEEFSKNAKLYGNMVHTVVPSWYQRPGYVQAMANLIQTELDAFTDKQKADAKLAAPDEKPLHVLFSAHGVPQSYIEAGDPYQAQIVECVEQIQAVLAESHPNTQVHLSYQSRVGPIEWLRPYTDDVLPELGQRGVKNLVVVPISFVSEHIETLEEIDIEYRELAEENGVEHWRRCPALNTDPAFIRDMADMVVEALQEPTYSVTEACVANNVAEIAATEDIPTVGIQGVGGAELQYVQSARSSFMNNNNAASSKNAGLQFVERITARVAIAGVLGTILLELVNGQSLMQMISNT